MSCRFRDFASRAVAWTAMLALVVQPNILLADVGTEVLPERSVRIADVELQDGGTLRGQVVSSQGKPFANADVQFIARGEMQSVATDESGYFEISELRGSTCQLHVGDHMQLVRVWAPGTAPPAATAGLLIVPNNAAVLGQNCGSGVCGSGKRRGIFGGGGGRHPLSHPLVVGSVIAAAIAIPLATSSDDPATP